MSTRTKAEQDRFMTVEVFHPNGHKSVLLEGLRRSASVSEIRARAMSGLRLPDNIDWNVRHERTGRLLQEDDRLGDVSDVSGQVSLKMQPDAGLG